MFHWNYSFIISYHFLGPGSMDGWLHDVCVRRSWRVRCSEGVGQTVPDEQDQGPRIHAQDHSGGKYYLLADDKL